MGTCLIIVASTLVTYSFPHFDATSQAVQFYFHTVAASSTAVALMFIFMVSFGGISSSIPWTSQGEVYPVMHEQEGRLCPSLRSI